MKPKYFFIIVCFLLISCWQTDNKKSKSNQEKQSKSITIRDFSFPDFSSEAQETIREWWSLKSLYQILISIAPAEKSAKILEVNNPDSLYVFKRMYINSPENIFKNSRIEKDWRKGELPSDTVYQLYKNRQDDFASLVWKETLLEEIPYTFSFYARASRMKNIKIEVLRQKDNKVIAEQNIRLDSLDENQLNTHTKITKMPDSWLKIDTEIQPSLDGMYEISIQYDEKETNHEYISLYRTQLLVPIKYQSKIKKNLEKLFGKKNTQSSYNGIYFWLFQVEDELRQLWARDNFPEKINTHGVRSRLKLFETYVAELSDNVKNNPHLTEEDLKLGLQKVQKSFTSFIEYINFLHQENVDEKIQKLLP